MSDDTEMPDLVNEESSDSMAFYYLKIKSNDGNIQGDSGIYRYI